MWRWNRIKQKVRKSSFIWIWILWIRKTWEIDCANFVKSPQQFVVSPPFFDYNTFWSINGLICTFPIPTVLITSYNWHRATKDSFGRFSTTKSEFTENPHGIKSWQFWKLEITPCNFHHVLVESTRNHLIDIFAW